MMFNRKYSELRPAIYLFLFSFFSVLGIDSIVTEEYEFSAHGYVFRYETGDTAIKIGIARVILGLISLFYYIKPVWRNIIKLFLKRKESIFFSLNIILFILSPYIDAYLFQLHSICFIVLVLGNIVSIYLFHKYLKEIVESKNRDNFKNKAI